MVIINEGFLARQCPGDKVRAGQEGAVTGGGKVGGTYATPSATRE